MMFLSWISLWATEALLPAQELPGSSQPLPPAPATSGPGTTLTWEDSVRLATANNPDIQVSREAVLNSDAVRRGAYYLLYPQITATFSDTRAYAGSTPSAPANYSTAYLEQISLVQTIFNGFLTKGNIDQARAELRLAFANLDEQKAATSFQLKSAFAQLLYAQQLIGISKNVIDILQNNARLVKLLYDGGNEDKGAMLLSQANLAQAIFAYNQALRTCGLAGLQLATTIGQNLPGPLMAKGELGTSPLPVTPNFTELALQTPLYHQRQAEADAAAAGITIAQSGFYPTVTAGASFDKEESIFFPHNQGASLGFSVSYPLFEGGRTYFDVKAAWASLRGALESLRSGTDQSALTLGQMFKSLVDASDNVGIQEQLLQATSLRYKIAAADYRNGLMSFTDFNTITNAYVSQQQALLSAHLNAVLAEADWEEARGLGAIP